ncbi:hypothetical protein [Prevotella pallens]|nr:hypothetical protein [Prevotella pallens]
MELSIISILNIIKYIPLQQGLRLIDIKLNYNYKLLSTFHYNKD